MFEMFRKEEKGEIDGAKNRKVSELCCLAKKLNDEKKEAEARVGEIDEFIEAHSDSSDALVDDEMYRLFRMKQFALYVYGESVRMCLESVKRKIRETTKGM